ncbi:unnamed protein product [Paramecium sonneborni]|uniref:Cyclin-dependent kinase 2 homolog n=1 Tax=Paramecium sonneborni TaxID=65129 RepID=A0A8S1RKH9_9CILI|nr:unnamed protein product [Paramecium sonneborni]
MNKYEILEQLEKVLMECFLNIKIRRRMKQKFKETEENEIVKKSIQRKVKILGLLRHTNIVELKEAVVQCGKFMRKGRIYLVFEYVESNLLEVLGTSSSGLEVLTITHQKNNFQLIKAIYCSHQKDIVHRDIKPENLLISNNHQLKSCDFSFARVCKQIYIKISHHPKILLIMWLQDGIELKNSCQFIQIMIKELICGCLLCELIDGNPLTPGENEMNQLYLIQQILDPFDIGLIGNIFKESLIFGNEIS